MGKSRPLGTLCQTGSIRSFQLAGIDPGTDSGTDSVTVRARPVSFLAVVGSSHSGANDRRRARRKCHRANARFGHTAAAAVIGSVLITAAAFSYRSHASWPHKQLHRRPKWRCPHAPAPLIDSSFGTPLARFVAPQGAPPKGPVATPACWTSPFRHTTHTFRGPIGGSTEGPSGKVHTAPPPHFGTPLTAFVAP